MENRFKSKGKYPYSLVAFTLTRKCTAQCKICCFSSSPSSKEKLHVDRIRSYIHEAAELDYIKTISFTGGEPFIMYSELKDLIELAGSYNKRITTITNGYWATSYGIAMKRLSELKRLGLSHLSVSYDKYHGEFIPLDHIRNIFKASTQIGLSTSLALVKLKEERIGDIINDLYDCLYTTNVEIIPCLPVGAAKSNFHEEDFEKAYSTDSSCLRCTYNSMIVVLYDGRILPCCSQMIVDSGLTIGNFYEISLKEALYKAKNNVLLYSLRNYGLHHFYTYSKETLGVELPSKVVNPCELCAHLFNEDIIKDYKPLFNHEKKTIET